MSASTSSTLLHPAQAENHENCIPPVENLPFRWFPVPAVSIGDLRNAIHCYESNLIWGIDAFSLFDDIFAHLDWRSLEERVKAFVALSSRPELAVYDLAFKFNIAPYERALLVAAAEIPLLEDEDPDVGRALEVIEWAGLAYGGRS